MGVWDGGGAPKWAVPAMNAWFEGDMKATCRPNQVDLYAPGVDCVVKGTQR